MISAHDVREYLSEYLVDDLTPIIDLWLPSAVAGWDAEAPTRHTFYIIQAKRLLLLLAEGVQQEKPPAAPLSRDREIALRHDFPLIYTPAMLRALAAVFAGQYRRQFGADDIDSEPFLSAINEGFAASSIAPMSAVSLSERLARLNHFSMQLSGMHDRDAIIERTLTEAPLLVDAESCMLWPWDADQQAPTMMVGSQIRTISFPFSEALLTLFRDASAAGYARMVDPEAFEQPWPPELIIQPFVLIPLLSQQGCLGMLTVHQHRGDRFTQDDLLLLSSLGNLVATALVNAQLFSSERHTVGLLQSSIRQVVQVTSDDLPRYEELLQSLLQVGEGLTRAEAVCAFVDLEGLRGPMTSISGSLANTTDDELQRLTRVLGRCPWKEDLPQTGVLAALFSSNEFNEQIRTRYYAMVEIPFNGKATGMVYALNTEPFSEDQLAFLRSITEQMGVGINNMQQSESVTRMLIQMSDISYVAETIANTFDAQRIFSTINQAASQALALPIVLCAWLEEDGSLRIIPDTVVGLTKEDESRIRLTINHAVIRQVLKTKQPVTSSSITGQIRHPFPVLADVGVEEWVCLPMVVKSEVRGIMLTADRQSHEFSARDIALLLTYANQAALAMNNSLLYEQMVERQSQQMESLITFARTISSTQEEATVHTELLRTATEELQVSAAVLTRTRPSSNTQYVAGLLGINGPDFAAREFAGGEGIIGSVAQWKAPIYSRDLASDGRAMALKDCARAEGFASSLTVPLIEHDQVLGTLTVLSRETHEFSLTQQYLLQALAITGALALRMITLVDPEVVSHYLTRDMMSHTLTTLSFTGDLLELTLRTEPKASGLERMKQRLEVIAAVQNELVGAHPTYADVKHAVLRLRESWLELAREPHPAIRIEGSRVQLPDRQALALALLIHEWVISALTVKKADRPSQLVLTFQQSYRDILVQFESDRPRRPNSAPVSPAILEYANYILTGQFDEQQEPGRYLARYSFNMPETSK